MNTQERQTSGPGRGAEDTAGRSDPQYRTAPAASCPDLRELDRRTCPSCNEGRVRVVEGVAGLLFSCTTGCPGNAIERAALRVVARAPTTSGIDTVVEQVRESRTSPAGTLKDSPGGKPPDLDRLHLVRGWLLAEAQDPQTAPEWSERCRRALLMLDAEHTLCLPRGDGPVELFGAAVSDVAQWAIRCSDRAERQRLSGLLQALFAEAERVRPRLHDVMAGAA